MFRKLIKYEFKSVGKWYFGLYALVMLVAPAMGFSIKAFEANSNLDLGKSTLMTLTSFLFFGLLVSIALSTLLLIINRFNKNIFGREGYLTLTLPVTTHQIILSKLASSMIWILLNVIVSVTSFVLIFLPLMSGSFGHLLAGLPQLAEVVSKLFMTTEFYLVLLLLLAGIVTGILHLYFAISIGQLFNNRRGLMAFVAYFGINIVTSIASNAFTHGLPEDMFFSNPVTLIGIAVNLVEIVIFYVGTHHIIKHKLNIQ